MDFIFMMYPFFLYYTLCNKFGFLQLKDLIIDSTNYYMFICLYFILLYNLALLVKTTFSLLKEDRLPSFREIINFFLRFFGLFLSLNIFCLCISPVIQAIPGLFELILLTLESIQYHVQVLPYWRPPYDKINYKATGNISELINYAYGADSRGWRTITDKLQFRLDAIRQQCAALNEIGPRFSVQYHTVINSSGLTSSELNSIRMFFNAKYGADSRYRKVIFSEGPGPFYRNDIQ